MADGDVELLYHWVEGGELVLVSLQPGSLSVKRVPQLQNYESSSPATTGSRWRQAREVCLCTPGPRAVLLQADTRSEARGHG